MKFLMTIILLFFVLMVTYTAQSATLTVAIDGLENIAPDNIWTYQLEFDIVGDTAPIEVRFNVTTQHQWVINPTTSVLNWDLLSNVNVDKLIILTENNATKIESPLVNGILFEVDYTALTELNLAFFSFVSEDLLDVKIPLNPIFDAGTNTLTFSAVPIPSSLLLLGGGIFALLGISRRKKG